MKFSYDSGERVRAADVDGPLKLTRYARERLGVEIPIGGARGKWYGRLKEEMEVQGWTWSDLTQAIDFCVAQGVQVRALDGIFYYVGKTSKKVIPRDPIERRVAQALVVETDETWVRRLSLASGVALERVYANWVSEREKVHAV